MIQRSRLQRSADDLVVGQTSRAPIPLISSVRVVRVILLVTGCSPNASLTFADDFRLPAAGIGPTLNDNVGLTHVYML